MEHCSHGRIKPERSRALPTLFIRQSMANARTLNCVDNFIKDVEPPMDQINKYGLKLDAYEELMQINNTERSALTLEMDMLKTKKIEKSSELKKNFKVMQNREEHVGYGLIYAKTGNQIPDKLVERSIRRQSMQMEQVATMRLKYIKLKGMVQEKLEAICQLDNIENNLHLADYEQLKAENRSYADKMEEREEELSRLRVKCQNTIQMLAHIREKSCALDTDLWDLKEELEESTSTSVRLRENLAYLKQSRDKYRRLTQKIKEDSGLLTKPDLLRDMEISQMQIKETELKISKYKGDVEAKTKMVRALRRNIESKTCALKKKKSDKSKTKSTGKLELTKKDKVKLAGQQAETEGVYRRLSQFTPQIEQTVFDDLVYIRPTPQVSTKKK